jgi:hypothetical protein
MAPPSGFAGGGGGGGGWIIDMTVEMAPRRGKAMVVPFKLVDCNSGWSTYEWVWRADGSLRAGGGAMFLFAARPCCCPALSIP